MVWNPPCRRGPGYKYGVTVSNLVLEDGSSLLGTPKEVRPLEPNRYWEPLRAALAGTTMRGCPPFEWHEEFRACLVALNASPAEAEEVRVRLGGEALRRDSTLRVFRDGRKVYIAGSRADKWTALQALLGEKAGDAVGVGDGANDLCWLSRVQRPCTLLDAAPEVVKLVEEKGGLVSTETGHEGILGLLRELAL